MLRFINIFHISTFFLYLDQKCPLHGQLTTVKSNAILRNQRQTHKITQLNDEKFDAHCSYSRREYGTLNNF